LNNLLVLTEHHSPQKVFQKPLTFARPFLKIHIPWDQRYEQVCYCEVNSGVHILCVSYSLVNAWVHVPTTD